VRPHGTRSRYAYGCRCIECRAAKAGYDRARYVRRREAATEVNWGIVEPGRLSAKPLDIIVRSREGYASAVLGVSGATWLEWKRIGIPWERADRVACKLGHHPIELFGDDWLEAQKVVSA
jgi:hypothetical protein